MTPKKPKTLLNLSNSNCVCFCCCACLASLGLFGCQTPFKEADYGMAQEENRASDAGQNATEQVEGKSLAPAENSATELQNLFWNCDGGNILSVSYFEINRQRDSSLPTAIQVSIQHAKRSFDLKAKIKAIHYSQVKKPLVWQSESGRRQDLVNVHSFLLQLKGGNALLRWAETTGGPAADRTYQSSEAKRLNEAIVSSVSLNIIERPDGQFLGNHRLIFEKSKSFAPPEIRFNNQCQFFKVNEYLLGNKDLLQKKFVSF